MCIKRQRRDWIPFARHNGRRRRATSDCWFECTLLASVSCATPPTHFRLDHKALHSQGGPCQYEYETFCLLCAQTTFIGGEKEAKGGKSDECIHSRSRRQRLHYHWLYWKKKKKLKLNRFHSLHSTVPFFLQWINVNGRHHDARISFTILLLYLMPGDGSIPVPKGLSYPLHSYVLPARLCQ